MDCMKDVVLNEEKRLSNKYNKKEKVVKIMLEKSIFLGYNINTSVGLIEEYLNSKNL